MKITPKKAALGGTRRIEEEVVYKEETLVLESVQDKQNILTFHRQIT